MNAAAGTRLLLVRHGQTDWNLAHRFQGQSDTPLTALGERQAHAAGQALARAHGAAIAAIYTSDLQRARRTAEIIAARVAEAAGTIPAIFPEPRLREMDFGAWEGLTYAEIQQRHPEALRRWEADLERHAPPGGETLLDLQRRVAAAQAEILEAHHGEKLLIISHGGPLQMWIAAALGLPPGRFWQLHLSNASISELAVYPEGAILNLLNSCAHLEAIQWES